MAADDETSPSTSAGSSTANPIRSAAELRRGSVFGLASAGYLTMGIGLVTGPLVARGVGPGGRGEIAIATLYATLALAVLSLGVPLAVSHHIANNLYSPGAIVATARRFALLLVLPSVLLAVALVVGPLRSISTPGRMGAFVLIATTPIAVLSTSLSYVLIGEGALRGLARTQLVPVFALALGIIGTYIFGAMTVGTYLAITFVTSLVALVVAWRAAGVTPTEPLPMGPFVGFGLRGCVAYIAAFGTIRIDQAFIGPLGGSKMLGYYAVSASLALVPYPLARAMAARSFGNVGAALEIERIDVVSSFVRISILVTAVCAVGMAAFCPFAVPLLYGKAFAASVVPLLILLPGTVFLSASASASASLVALGRPGRAMRAELVGLGITLAGLPVVVPRAGIKGAAVLSTVAYVATFAAYRSQLRRVGRVRVMPGPADVRSAASHIVARVSREHGRWPRTEATR